MNLFIYDDFLKRHGKSINQVEATLHNLNLSGKIIYLESIKKIDELIKNEIVHGAKNIIAVGNNHTFNKVLNVVMTLDPKTISALSLGIIPIGENNSIAESFGINDEKTACHIILARRLEKIDVVQANDSFFIHTASLPAKGSILKIKEFSIDPIKNGEIILINILPKKSPAKNITGNPQDGLLNLYIINQKNPSFFLLKEMEIENNRGKLILDESLEVNLPAQISVGQHKINVIVGRDRTFNIE